jgi:hypothetical protein
MSLSYRVRAAALAAIALVSPLTAKSQAVIKVNDSTSIRVGLLGQMWVDFAQNIRQDSSYAQNIFLRRMRFIVGGQIGSKLAFFFQTDNPNLGRATQTAAGKAPGAGFILQDAYIEVKPWSSPFYVEGGLLLIPLCRNCIASAASLLPIDYGAYSFLQSAGTQSSNGRDVGLMAKGTLVDQHVEYRAGMFSGARLTNTQTPTVQTASNALRGAGHLMINFWETEAPGYVLPGTYLGRRKVFNIGAGGDFQGGQYKAIAGDAFLSYPLGANGVTLATTFIHFDGGTLIPALPRQNTVEVEGGYHFTDAKFTPWAKFETRSINSAFLNAANQNDHRIQIGGTYYWLGNTLNVKAAYTRTNQNVFNSGDLTSNGFTLQLQGFYY